MNGALKPILFLTQRWKVKAVAQSLVSRLPLQDVVVRASSTASSHENPLEFMKEQCIKYGLCDDNGRRLDNAHWVASMSTNPSDSNEPPNLRTIGIQRLTFDGVDVCFKAGGKIANSLSTSTKGLPMSLMWTQGKLKYGEEAVQWRLEGYAKLVEKDQDEIIRLVPSFTIFSMVASKRMAAERLENNKGVKDKDGQRQLLDNKSHFVELIQQVRHEYETDTLSMDELSASISPVRVHPTRMEKLQGGPDRLMWDRHEWFYDDTELSWKEAQQLLPH